MGLDNGEQIARTDVARVGANGEINALYKEPKAYERFPNMRLNDCCIIAYQLADRTKDKFNPPVEGEPPRVIPSTRFLFSNGVIRKWTSWLKISYTERSKLVTMWQDIPNIEQKIINDKWLFNTPFQLMLKQAGEFQEIMFICLGTNQELVDKTFYNEEFRPFKHVKAFSEIIPLNAQVTKLPSGIVQWGPADFVNEKDVKKV